MKHELFLVIGYRNQNTWLHSKLKLNRPDEIIRNREDSEKVSGYIVKTINESAHDRGILNKTKDHQKEVDRKKN